MVKIISIFFGVAIVISGGLLVWIAFQTATRPAVSITLINYTNDLSGAPIARFAISNGNPSAVYAYMPLIAIPAPGKPRGELLSSVKPGFWGRYINPSASQTYTCSVPTNEPTWRLQLLVYPDVGAARLIKHTAVYGMWMLGIKPRYQTMPFNIEGDWIEQK
jgi:hypothetical protein